MDINLSTRTNNLAIDTKRARRDLNPRPTEPESVALSTEPRALNLFDYNTPRIKFADELAIALL